MPDSKAVKSSRHRSRCPRGLNSRPSEAVALDTPNLSIKLPDLQEGKVERGDERYRLTNLDLAS